MATIEHGKVTLNAQEARQGKELGVMRYVLHISLALSVIARHQSQPDLMPGVNFLDRYIDECVGLVAPDAAQATKH